jgi:pantothenate synthetase
MAKAKTAQASRDILKEMLSDVHAKLDAIGDVIANLPTHGDLHDDHVDLAKRVKKLARETHSVVKAANAAAKKART